MIEQLNKIFTEFGVKVDVTQGAIGPHVTTYEIRPAPGVHVHDVFRLAPELRLRLGGHTSLRMGLGAIYLMVPNEIRKAVRFEDMLEAYLATTTGPLPFIVGQDEQGYAVYADLADMPHLLIGGTTGSGKSVMVNTIITSLINWATPEDVQFVMIDLKLVELAPYTPLPHLLLPIITDPDEAERALNYLVGVMENRFGELAQANVRDIGEYNIYNRDGMPYMVVVIDELADLMLRNPNAERPIVLLAQKARAVGIHLVVATQRPTVNVVTGLIKANMPSRMAFTVASELDSRVILDENGAEDLMGKGDLLFKQTGTPTERIQAVLTTNSDVRKAVEKGGNHGDSLEELPQAGSEEAARH